MILPKNRKQKNKNFLVPRLLPPNSRGISIIIGYVLLVTFAISNLPLFLIVKSNSDPSAIFVQLTSSINIETPSGHSRKSVGT
ncbi:hypothetical protein ES703_102399 [subsurface metagenome]